MRDISLRWLAVGTVDLRRSQENLHARSHSFALSPVDAGRGRPAPDLVLTAMLRAQVSTVHAVAAAGDTSSDVASGLSAGAGFVVGVLSGAHDRLTLADAGAHAVLRDVTELPGALAERGVLRLPQAV